MKATAAVLSGKNQVYVKEVDLPEIGEEELLVKIVSNSVCLSTYKAAIRGGDHKRVDEELAKSQEKSKAMKQEGKDILSGTKEEAVSTADINKVVFACDAGLGSSAMGATSFRKSTGSKSGNSYCNHSKLFKRSEHR